MKLAELNQTLTKLRDTTTKLDIDREATDRKTAILENDLGGVKFAVAQLQTSFKRYVGDLCDRMEVAEAKLLRAEQLLCEAAANQSELADIVARLQHRIERLESASADRYDRFIIPLEN